MIDVRETIINGIMVALQHDMDTKQMQITESAVRAQLRDYTLIKECTEVSTEMDDNWHILKRFAANKKLEGCKENSIKQFVRSNRNFLEWINKNYKNITKDDIKIYLAFYGKSNKQNTVFNMKRYLSTFYTWLYDEGYTQKNPVKTIKIKPEEVENIHLSIEQELAVRDIANISNKRDLAIIDLLLSTGLRVGEIEVLNHRDIDLQEGSITLKSEKSGRYRTVYLDARAKKHLREYLETRKDNCEALFVTNGKKKVVSRLRKHNYQQITKRIGVEAGITDKNCTVHVFRRTFATRLAERGCPLEIIQELLGHASADTTSKHYVAKSNNRIKKECERYLISA